MAELSGPWEIQIPNLKRYHELAAKNQLKALLNQYIATLMHLVPDAQTITCYNE